MAEKITVADFLKDAVEKISSGFIIAALTDQYVVDKWPSEERVKLENEGEKVLEIRIFDKESELKISRTEMGAELGCRVLSDADGGREYFDEVQYLDIDDKSIGAGDKVRATGGGEYNLPLTKKSNAKIRIRYYLGKYEETGQARVEDWRIVELVEGK
jgi:hypothetical protein